MAIEDVQGLDLGSETGGATDFLSHILREHFLPDVADCLNHDYVLLERWAGKKTHRNVQGTNVRYPAHIGRNYEGFGAIGEDGFLPDPGSPEWDTYRFTLRRITHRQLFSLFSETASKGEIDAWLEAQAAVFADARDTLARQENRMLHNDGR